VTQSGTSNYLSPDWVQVSPTTTPPVTSAATMAYDPATSQVVMFGGCAAACPSSATWLWNGTTWSLGNPTTVPPARLYQTMAWDPALNEIIMFGGSGATSYLNDTWAWNGSNWSQLATTAPPAARTDAGMSFDPAINKLVLFGGFGVVTPTSGNYNDTWTFDGANWVNVVAQGSAGSPTYRGGGSMGATSETSPNQFLLFGGNESPCAGSGCSLAVGNDTWSFSGTAWSQLAPSQSPPARAFASGSFDSNLGSFVVFGGESGGFDLNDTWAWNGTTWLSAAGIATPPGRQSASMASVDAFGQLVLFGGIGASGGLSDTWVQDPTPGTPTAIVAFPGNGQAEVTWAAPAYTGNAPIDSYYIIGYPATGTPVGSITTCGITCSSGVISGLSNGVAWAFAVYAHSSSGFSIGGVTTANITPSANPTPYPATGAGVSPGNADAFVSWTAPPANGGAALAGYYVDLFNDVSGSPVYIGYQFVSATTTSMVYTGLTNGNPYQFTVYADNAVGYVETPNGSVTAKFTPTTTPPPFPPTSPSATAGDTTAQVSWTANPSGSAATSYIVLEYTFVNHTFTYIRQQTVLAPINTDAFTGLTDGTQYAFLIYAVNAYGGEAAVTNLVTPTAVVAAPSAPTGVTATGGNAQATVSWAASVIHGSPVTSYTVTSSPGGKVATTANGTTLTATVTGLTNGSSYTFTVVANSAAGSSSTSAASNSVTPSLPASAPSAPTGVAATAGNAQATVTWVASVTNGSPVTTYTVTTSPGGTMNTTTGAPTSYVVTGLTNGTPYTFTVVANSAAGSSPASAPSNPVTPSLPASAPSAPTGVTATAGNAQATVTWVASVTNGSPVTTYTVTTSPGGTMNTTTGAPTSYVVTGLTNGTPYTFTVVANSAAGSSPASAPSNPVTPMAGPPPPACHSSTYCWGLDSAGTQSAATLSAAATYYGGTPDFFGRYLTSGGGPSALTASEVAVFHAQNLPLLLLADLHGSCASSANGTQEADTVASAATALGVPANAGIAVYLDIEPSSATVAACITAYADELATKGFQPGFYENPAAADFGTPFCAAAAPGTDANVDNALLWSQQPDQGQTGPATSPPFAPMTVPCTAGTTVAWQYAIAAPSGVGQGYDNDELSPGSEASLWRP
jgi:hypothetical protein